MNIKLRIAIGLILVWILIRLFGIQELLMGM